MPRFEIAGEKQTRKREKGESQKLIRWYRIVEGVTLPSDLERLISDIEKADFSLRSK
jgi:phosphoenolpyruvate synthase/pyruvate phosphate dikinase